MSYLTCDHSTILKEIAAERARQDTKWGEQNHPDGTGGIGRTMDAQSARQECQRQFAEGDGNWLVILEEEIAEAFAETGPTKLRHELVQVAAVAVAWIEAIDRRGVREVEQPPTPTGDQP